jgi:RNA polymerase sigma-70 factor (ECF subfamily)
LFKNGDEKAFEALYHRFSSGLFNYLARLIGDWHYAEDILVETFTKLANSNLEEKGSLKAWIYRVTTNACYRSFREKRGEVCFSEERFQKNYNDPGPDLIREMKMQKLLSKLPDYQRAVLVLKFYEEMTYQEIANILCCPLGTVKSRIYEGLRKLRKLIEHGKHYDNK